MNNEQNILCSCTLDAESVDSVSEVLTEALEKADVPKANIIRYRLAFESVMQIWAEALGENTRCELKKKNFYGTKRFILQAEGFQVDPTTYRDELLLDVSNISNMTVALGLQAEYRYLGGRNQLTLSIARKTKIGYFGYVVIALIAAVIIGLGMRVFLGETAVAIANDAINPIMDTITNLIRLISTPVIFLAVLCGITGTSNQAGFAKMGKALIVRIVLISYLLSVIMAPIVWACFGIEKDGSGGNNPASAILQMVLDIVPDNIITPFSDGNALQVIFLAIIFGIGLLVLGDSMSETVMAIHRINSLVQQVMMVISRTLPFYIFLCVTSLVITSDMSSLKMVIEPTVVAIAISVALPLIFGLYASARTKIPYLRLLKYQLPSYIIAVSSASSAAAYSESMECCEKKLGVDKHLVNFGLPLGHVLFKPGSIALQMTLPLFAAAHYGIAITPQMAVMQMISAALIAMSAPPVPGGGIAAMLVMFAQMGIPTESMAIYAAVLTFTDYTITACNVSTLQQLLAITNLKLKKR